MVGFEKYEKLLNKKRKKEAYLNLVASKKGDETSCITKGSTSNNEERSDPDDIQGIKEVYWDIKKKVKNLHQMLKETPKLKLLPIGEESLLNKQCPFTLKNDQIYYLIEEALTGNATKHLTWCTLKQRDFLSKIVVVIMDGFGIKELTAISDWNSSKKCPTSPNGEAAVPEVNSLSDEGNLPPPSKKMKRCDLEDGSKMQPVISGKDTRGQSDMLLTALPSSASLFSLHLNMQAATQVSCFPLEKLLCKIVTWDTISSKIKEIKEQEQNAKLHQHTLKDENVMDLIKYSSNKDLKWLNDLISSNFVTSCSKSIMIMENNFPKTFVSTIKNEEISRCSLLLSLQEMIKFNYPLPIPGLASFEDNEFAYLHTTFKEVTHDSPLFAIDCEMCETKRGLELAWVSVINEKYESLYTKLVKPPYPVFNYLTRYSGITHQKLLGVTTKLKDVQESLRQVIPPNGILVGHSLNSDLNVLKLYHPYVIDTSIIFNISGVRNIRPSLKFASAHFLNKEIQSSLSLGHNPTEDACASLNLVFLKLEKGISFGDSVKKKDFLSQSKVSHLAKKISRQTLPKKLMLDVNKDYLVNLFAIAEYANKSSVIITTEAGIQKVKTCLTTQEKTLTTYTVKKPKDVLEMAIKDDIQADLLICHCLMPEFPKICSKEKAKKKLASLDKRLADLRSSLPPDSLILTVFTGSPLSVPLEERSNAAVMVDLVGQEKSSFFR